MSDDAPTVVLDRAWLLPDRLRVLAPDAVGVLAASNMWAWRAFPPVILEELRLRIAALIGNDAGMRRRSRAALESGLSESKVAQLGNYYASAAFSPAERDCLELTEQFVLDVTGPMAGYVEALEARFPGQMHALVTALYVTEFTQRVEMMARALFDEPAHDTGRPDDLEVSWTGPAEQAQTALTNSHRQFQSAVMRMTALDPVLTELVRLRCARTHNCRICQTLRLSGARAAGADDAMTAKVDFYEQSDLDERTKVALRITDAMITGPDKLDAEVIAAARTHFTPAERAELCLDITKWSTQKIHVSLGTDGADALPKSADGLSFFDFDQEGRVAGFSATPASR